MFNTKNYKTEQSTIIFQEKKGTSLHNHQQPQQTHHAAAQHNHLQPTHHHQQQQKQVSSRIKWAKRRHFLVEWNLTFILYSKYLYSEANWISSLFLMLDLTFTYSYLHGQTKIAFIVFGLHFVYDNNGKIKNCSNNSSKYHIDHYCITYWVGLPHHIIEIIVHPVQVSKVQVFFKFCLRL